MKKCILFNLIGGILFTFGNINAQKPSCGTGITLSQITLENTINVSAVGSNQSLPQANRKYSIAVYIVKDSSYQAGVTQTELDAALNLLNENFQPIALSFHICSTNYVNNYQFNSLYTAKNGTSLTTEFATTDMINLYLVEKLYDSTSVAVNGLTYYPAAGKNYIFLKKSALTTNEIVHQMGHFFNLYHTHETALGVELVSRSSGCSTTGDKCCDTNADPNISGASNSNCEYSGSLSDSNGTKYQPSVKNFMSYGDISCRCNFTPTQYVRIVYAVKNLRKTLN
jgi:hypothetical protein